MAKLTLTGSEFANIVMLFLYDKLSHPDEIIEADVNETFNAFMEVMFRRGMKAPLLQCYMDMKPQLRVQYRLIRNTFMDNTSGKISNIEIHKDVRPDTLKPGVFKRIKNIVKKIVLLGLAIKAGSVIANKVKGG
jgi:hypothetical protein